MNKTLFHRKPIRAGKPEPLYTTAEVAERIGQTLAQLRWHMTHAQIKPPEPRLKRSYSHGNLYALSEIRSWLKQVNALAASPNVEPVQTTH